MSLKRLWFCAAVAAALPSACSAAGKESAVGTVGREMQAFCFGRHQFALPRHFEEMPGTSAIFTPPGLTQADAPIDVTVKSGRIDPASFQLEVDKRQEALTSASRKRRNVLQEVIAINEEATLFRILVIDTAYKNELHFWKSGSYVVATTASYDNSHQQAEARLNEFMANVESASSSARQPAFCLGSVVVKGKYASEYANFGFRSKEMKDIIVSLVVDSFAPDEKVDLLKRAGGEDSFLNKFKADSKVLRQGEISVSGMRAQEWLGSVMLGERGDEKQFLFSMETVRPAPSQMQPRMHLKLDTGQYGENGEQYKNVLNDQSAVALWDSIVKSIRPRP